MFNGLGRLFRSGGCGGQVGTAHDFEGVTYRTSAVADRFVLPCLLPLCCTILQYVLRAEDNGELCAALASERKKRNNQKAVFLGGGNLRSA